MYKNLHTLINTKRETLVRNSRNLPILFFQFCSPHFWNFFFRDFLSSLFHVLFQFDSSMSFFMALNSSRFSYMPAFLGLIRKEGTRISAGSTSCSLWGLLRHIFTRLIGGVWASEKTNQQIRAPLLTTQHGIINPPILQLMTSSRKKEKKRKKKIIFLSSLQR